MAKKKKPKKPYCWTTPALCLSLFSLSSCEVLAPVARPVVERTVEVVRDPRVADANQDGKTSWGEKLAYILGVGGMAVAAYMKARGAQQEVDQQWDAKLATAEAAAVATGAGAEKKKG